MKLLIVEDDYIQAKYIEENLMELLNNATIKRISTESQFYDFLEIMNEDKPDVILLDIMLRWTNPSPTMPEMPENVKEEGFHWAGIRCENKLRKMGVGKTIPVIIYSVIEKNTYSKFVNPEKTKFLNKDFDMQNLRNLILKFK